MSRSVSLAAFSIAFAIAQPELRFNFASAEMGAKVLAANPEAKGAAKLLQVDRDKYLRNPCDAPRKWVIIELSDEARITTFAMANYEYYAFSPRNFTLLGSAQYPCSAERGCLWQLLGTFEAENHQLMQYFPVPRPLVIRYLKVLFLSFYGRGPYCTVSKIRVYGSSLLDDLQSSVAEDNGPRSALTSLRDRTDEEEAEADMGPAPWPKPAEPEEADPLEALLRSLLSLEKGEPDHLPDVELEPTMQPSPSGQSEVPQTGASSLALVPRPPPAPSRWSPTTASPRPSSSSSSSSNSVAPTPAVPTASSSTAIITPVCAVGVAGKIPSSTRLCPRRAQPFLRHLDVTYQQDAVALPKVPSVSSVAYVVAQSPPSTEPPNPADGSRATTERCLRDDFDLSFDVMQGFCIPDDPFASGLWADIDRGICWPQSPEPSEHHFIQSDLQTDLRPQSRARSWKRRGTGVAGVQDLSEVGTRNGSQPQPWLRCPAVQRNGSRRVKRRKPLVVPMVDAPPPLAPPEPPHDTVVAPTPPPVQPPLPHDEAPGPDTAVAEAMVPMAGAGTPKLDVLRSMAHRIKALEHYDADSTALFAELQAKASKLKREVREADQELTRLKEVFYQAMLHLLHRTPKTAVNATEVRAAVEALERLGHRIDLVHRQLTDQTDLAETQRHQLRALGVQLDRLQRRSWIQFVTGLLLSIFFCLSLLRCLGPPDPDALQRASSGLLRNDQQAWQLSARPSSLDLLSPGREGDMDDRPLLCVVPATPAADRYDVDHTDPHRDPFEPSVAELSPIPFLTAVPPNPPTS